MSAFDRLYGAPFDAFLTLRKELVAEARAAGDAEAARRIAAAAKPTRTAWALNQVARRHPEHLKALLHARQAAASPAAGDAEALRRATRDYRERVADVVRAARDALAGDGVELNATQARRMAETVQAACSEGEETRERLVAGRLTRDVEIEDPFAGLSVGEERREASRASGGRGAKSPEVAPARGKTKEQVQKEREREEQERKDREARVRAIKAARERVTELEAVARTAREEARAAEAAVARSLREAERAKHSADDAESRLEEARQELGRLTS